jgi:acyl dehydratase
MRSRVPAWEAERVRALASSGTSGVVSGQLHTKASRRVSVAGELLYYDDVEVGFTSETGGMVITESHVVQFAGLSGDFFDLHMDDAFARSLGFPKRVAHGLLGLILVDGLKNRVPRPFAGVASLSWQWHFRAPVFIGDRISARLTVSDKRTTKRPERGILTLTIAAHNQDGAVVQDGSNLVMVRRRVPGGEAS